MHLNNIKRYVELRQALTAEKLKLETRLAAIDRALGGENLSPLTAPASARRRKGQLTSTGRARPVAAQKARRAKVKAGKKTGPVVKKRKLSAAAKAKLAEIAKARWAKAKAAGKTKL